jgi:hypothetical protein
MKYILLSLLVVYSLGVSIVQAQHRHTAVHQSDKSVSKTDVFGPDAKSNKSNTTADFQTESLVQLVKSECQSAQLLYKRKKYGLSDFGISADSALDRAYNIFVSLDKSGDSVLFRAVAEESIKSLTNTAQVMRRTDVILKIVSLMAIYYPNETHCHCGKCENKN